MYAATSSEASLNTAMAKVYGTMGFGLLLTFLVSYFIGTSPGMIQQIFTSGLKWPILLAPLALIFIMSWGSDSFSATTLKVLFAIFSILEGVSLSVIFVVYTKASIGSTLIIASLIFGGMSGYGYFTKKDLTGMGSLLIVTLLGLLVAMVVNLFLHSSMMEMLISFVGVLLFIGFVAYDSQAIRLELWNSQDRERAVVMGAVTLYLDMLNLFLFLLRLFGVKVPGKD